MSDLVHFRKYICRGYNHTTPAHLKTTGCPFLCGGLFLDGLPCVWPVPYRWEIPVGLLPLRHGGAHLIVSLMELIIPNHRPPTDQTTDPTRPSFRPVSYRPVTTPFEMSTYRHVYPLPFSGFIQLTLCQTL